MQRLEQLLARNQRGSAPDIGDRGVAQLLSDLSTGMGAEVQRHFDFEENQLFPYLNGIGEDAIGAHLADEHRAIRPIGIKIAKLARGAAAQGFDEATWDEFRRLGQELCEQLPAHAQKEDMALLPLLEDSMDADTEARLLEEYLQAT
jgi:hemerythrin-like domain-containing protein